MDMATRRAYQEKADAELRVWNAHIEELLARAEAKKASGKVALYKRLERLREQRDTVRDQLAELQDASGDAWNDLKESFEQAHQELTTKFHSALDRFRDDDGNEISAPPSSSGDSAHGSASIGG